MKNINILTFTLFRVD